MKGPHTRRPSFMNIVYNGVSSVLGIGTAFSATAGAVKGVLSVKEAITSSQVGDVNVFKINTEI